MLETHTGWSMCASNVLRTERFQTEQVPNVVALCIGSVAGVSAATITFPLEVCFPFPQLLQRPVFKASV